MIPQDPTSLNAVALILIGVLIGLFVGFILRGMHTL